MLPEVTGTEMRLSCQKVASCVCMRGPNRRCKGAEVSPDRKTPAQLLRAEAQPGQGNLGQEADGPQGQMHPENHTQPRLLPSEF